MLPVPIACGCEECSNKYLSWQPKEWLKTVEVLERSRQFPHEIMTVCRDHAVAGQETCEWIPALFSKQCLPSAGAISWIVSSVQMGFPKAVPIPVPFHWDSQPVTPPRRGSFLSVRWGASRMFCGTLACSLFTASEDEAVVLLTRTWCHGGLQYGETSFPFSTFFSSCGGNRKWAVAVLQALRRNGCRDNSPEQDSAGPGEDHQPYTANSGGLQQEHSRCTFLKLLGNRWSRQRGQTLLFGGRPLLEHHCLWRRYWPGHAFGSTDIDPGPYDPEKGQKHSLGSPPVQGCVCWHHSHLSHCMYVIP